MISELRSYTLIPQFGRRENLGRWRARSEPGQKSRSLDSIHQHIIFLCKSTLVKGVRSKEETILIKPSFLFKTISGYARGIWIHSVSIIHAVC